jgi:hypothetical protein
MRYIVKVTEITTTVVVVDAPNTTEALQKAHAASPWEAESIARQRFFSEVAAHDDLDMVTLPVVTPTGAD